MSDFKPDVLNCHTVLREPGDQHLRLARYFCLAGIKAVGDVAAWARDVNARFSGRRTLERSQWQNRQRANRTLLQRSNEKTVRLQLEIGFF